MFYEISRIALFCTDKSQPKSACLLFGLGFIVLLATRKSKRCLDSSAVLALIRVVVMLGKPIWFLFRS